MLDRVLLTVGTLLFAATFYALMLKGWRSRQHRQGDLPAPPVATRRTNSRSSTWIAMLPAR